MGIQKEITVLTAMLAVIALIAVFVAVLFGASKLLFIIPSVLILPVVIRIIAVIIEDIILYYGLDK